MMPSYVVISCFIRASAHVCLVFILEREVCIDSRDGEPDGEDGLLRHDAGFIRYVVTYEDI